MRNFSVVKLKTGEELFRCGSSKSAKRWVDGRFNEYMILNKKNDEVTFDRKQDD